MTDEASTMNTNFEVTNPAGAHNLTAAPLALMRPSPLGNAPSRVGQATVAARSPKRFGLAGFRAVSTRVTPEIAMSIQFSEMVLRCCPQRADGRPVGLLVRIGTASPFVRPGFTRVPSSFRNKLPKSGTIQYTR